ncbi:amidase signature enzyme [Abortiporus biennis]|nr:amidase signature enzyme [Abortiporus biennis]
MSTTLKHHFVVEGGENFIPSDLVDMDVVKWTHHISQEHAHRKPYHFTLLKRFVTVACAFFLIYTYISGWGAKYLIKERPIIELPDLYEASIAELQSGLEEGRFTSVDLVKAYLARIEEVNHQGPTLRAVIETNPIALEQAKTLDLERKMFRRRGPLHGIPIVVKDNIATMHSEGMNTTAGSYALLGSVVPRDAHVIARLRAAGAIILGKANLSEWSSARGDVPSGFTGRGGQCFSPYVPLGNPSGSSSGSGISTAIGLAAAALGTETDGSIVQPSSIHNLVGIKPTVGLTSRAGVIPISEHQDSVGPMCRSVADAAAILTVIAGKDPLDNYTLAQPPIIPDYTKALNKSALNGIRVGVARKFAVSADPYVIASFNATLDIFRGLGAVVVDPADLPSSEEILEGRNETIVSGTDLKFGINKYISELVDVPTGVKNISDLIAFNTAHADQELIPPYWEDQSTFERVQSRVRDQDYYRAIAFNKELGRTRGIDAALQKHGVDVLIAPTGEICRPAAIAGYPIITVPLGFFPAETPLSPAKPIRYTGPNMPFGISFTGTAYSEFKLISYAFAYEQATHARLRQLAYPEAIPKTQLRDILRD